MAAQMKVCEGDSLYLTDLLGAGYRVTPYDPELVEQMKVMEKLASRYQNTLEATVEYMIRVYCNPPWLNR